jgi:hypothetical protein
MGCSLYNGAFAIRLAWSVEITEKTAVEFTETYHMIVALVSVGWSLLTESSLKVPRFAEMSAAISIPFLPEDVCYLLVK